MERYIYICNSMSLSRIYSREIQNLLRVYIGLSIVGIWRECDCFLRFRNDRRFVFFFFAGLRIVGIIFHELNVVFFFSL